MDVLAPLGPVYQAGTLSGNPLATAAGLAALELLDDAAYDDARRLAPTRSRGGLADVLRRGRARRAGARRRPAGRAVLRRRAADRLRHGAGRPTRSAYARVLPRAARSRRRRRPRRLRGDVPGARAHQRRSSTRSSTSQARRARVARRPHRRADVRCGTMAAPQSDALVLFGITGDLAKKKMFPAVYHMATATVCPTSCRSSACVVDGPRTTCEAAVREPSVAVETKPSTTRSSRRLRQAAQLRVAATTATTSTFENLKDGARGRRAPALLPGHPAGALRRRRRRASPSRAQQGRHASSSRSRSAATCASAQELNEVLHSAFPRAVDLPHRPLPRQGAGREPARVPLRQLAARADLEPQLHQLVQITMAEAFGVEGRGKFYDTVGALRDVVQNHLLEIVALLAMEPPVAADADALRDEKVKVFRQIDAFDPSEVVRGPVPRLRRRRRRATRLRHRDVRRPALPDRLVALGRRAVADPRRQGAAGRPRPRRSSSSRRRRGCCSPSSPACRARPEPPALPARRGRRHHAAPPGEGARRRADHPGRSTSRCPTRRCSAAAQRPYERLLEDAMDGDRPPVRPRATRSTSSGASSTPLLHMADPRSISTTEGTWGRRGRGLARLVRRTARTAHGLTSPDA